MHVVTASNSTAQAVRAVLQGFSIEVTPGDVKSIDAASLLLPAGTETFIASLPKGTADQMVVAASQLRRSGMTPVPHIAARAFSSAIELESMLGKLSEQAGVERALLIAGDRDTPAGPYHCGLQVLQSGILEKHGIKTVYLPCYPEGHPRIGFDLLEEARVAKLEVANQRGFKVELVSQFCFEAAPIIGLGRQMRDRGLATPYRVGLAGPASSTTLLKYAMMCGVGASMRALRERQTLTKNLLSGPTPEDLIETLALARQAEPGVGFDGLHFFTFGSLVSVRRVLESYESPVIQGWWPDSRRGHRCGRARTAPVTTAASCDIRAI